MARTARYRTTVRAECAVDDGDDVAALDEAREAVARERDAGPVRWERTDDGVVFYAELSSKVSPQPPGPTPRTGGVVQDTARAVRGGDTAPGPEGL